MNSSVELLKVIKSAAMESVAQAQPSGLYFGTVLKPEPLEVQIEQKIILKKEQLLKLETPKCKDAEGSCPDGKVSIWGYRIDDELKKDDKLALIRQQGGQLYLILGKVAQV